MIDIGKGPKEKAGTWRYLSNGEVQSASFTCPKCGLPGTLEDHDIDIDGTVAPSVECPDEKCGFHDRIRLIDWKR